MVRTLREMSEVERAYVGSAIDTDGCVMLQPHPMNPERYRYWRVVFVNLEPELISALLRATGTGRVVASDSYGRDGRVTGLRYEWKLSTQADVRALAEQCSPYSTKLQKVLA